MKINESGRSMIEMLGVLSIISVLSTSGIALYSKAMDKRKTSVVIDQVSELANNIHNVYMSRRNYSSLKLTGEGGIIKSGDKHKIIPASMYVKDNGKLSAVRHALGKKDETIDFAVDSDNDKYFYITAPLSDNVKTCVSLVTSDWGEGNYVCVGKVIRQVDAKKAANSTSKTCAEGSMDTSTASGKDLCNACKGSCTVSFIMR